MIKKILCVILLIALKISSAESVEVKELTSSYGVKFWYSRDDSAPLVNVAIAFRNCGSAHMDKIKSSVPDLFIRTIFCGCGNYSKEEFQEGLKNISAKLDGHSDNDDIVFFFKYPKIVSAEAISFLKAMLSAPKFEKTEVEKKKNFLSYRLENHQTAPIFWSMNILFPQLLFKDHPYGNNIDNSEYLLKLDDTDLKSFHKKYIVRSNVELCIFGDISKSEAVKLADQVLSSIPKGEKASDKIPNIKPSLKNFVKKYHIEGPQSYVIFVLPHTLNSEHKFAISILYLLLGGDSFKSRITEELRSKSGLIYSGGIYKTEQKHSCFEIGILQTSNRNVDIVIDRIKFLIKNIREKGISREELDFAKSNIRGTFLVNLRTSEDLCRFYMGKKLQGYSEQALEKFLQGINSVTLNQVNSVAKKILDEENIPIVVIGGSK